VVESFASVGIVLLADDKELGLALSLDRLTSTVSCEPAPPKPKSSKLRASWLAKEESPDGSPDASVLELPPEPLPTKLASSLLVALP
jgi:hypothetical protein